MSKRWTINPQRPSFKSLGDFAFVRVTLDWSAPCQRISGADGGHVALTVMLLGFGVTVIRWGSPDVYGDGGVA